QTVSAGDLQREIADRANTLERSGALTCVSVILCKPLVAIMSQRGGFSFFYTHSPIAFIDVTPSRCSSAHCQNRRAKDTSSRGRRKSKAKAVTRERALDIADKSNLEKIVEFLQ